MIFFIFLFFGVFFALVLIGVQSSAGLRNERRIARQFAPGVNMEEVSKEGDVDNIESILIALEKKSKNTIFSESSYDKYVLMFATLGELKGDIIKIKTEIMVFKLIVAGMALICGFIAAFLTLTDQISI